MKITAQKNKKNKKGKAMLNCIKHKSILMFNNENKNFFFYKNSQPTGTIHLIHYFKPVLCLQALWPTGVAKTTYHQSIFCFHNFLHDNIIYNSVDIRKNENEHNK